MKKIVSTFIAFLLVSVSLFAQENETKKTFAYSNISEFGIMVASPWNIAFEATTVHGFSVVQKHHIGLGFGLGLALLRYDETGYIPLFVNYRFYFKSSKTIYPHINVAIGGLIVEAEGENGIYTSLTAGFRVGMFSFSTGFSFLPMPKNRGVMIYYPMKEIPDRNYPFGLTLKLGFAF